MKFLSCTILLAASAAAQQAYNTILNPGANSVIQAGGGVQSITWSNPSPGNVSLALYSGSNPVVTVAPLASSIANTGTFMWTPETWLPSGNDYTIGIVDLSGTAETQYSPFFRVELCSTCTSSVRSTTSSFSAQTVSVSGLDIGTRTDAAFPVVTAAPSSTVSLASGAANTASATGASSRAASSVTAVAGLNGSSVASQASALGASANSILSSTANASPTSPSSTSGAQSLYATSLILIGFLVALF